MQINDESMCILYVYIYMRIYSNQYPNCESELGYICLLSQYIYIYKMLLSTLSACNYVYTYIYILSINIYIYNYCGEYVYMYYSPRAICVYILLSIYIQYCIALHSIYHVGCTEIHIHDTTNKHNTNIHIYVYNMHI